MRWGTTGRRPCHNFFLILAEGREPGGDRCPHKLMYEVKHDLIVKEWRVSAAWLEAGSRVGSMACCAEAHRPCDIQPAARTVRAGRVVARVLCRMILQEYR
jgi:hypothetical protein